MRKLALAENLPIQAITPHGFLGIVLMGPPAVGKGTQAKRLAQAYSIPAISTGEILRAEVDANTPLGVSIKQTLADGGFVSDKTVCDIVQARVQDQSCKCGFILDGFPRNLDQAIIFDSFLLQNTIPLRIVIQFVCEESELLRRVAERAKMAITPRPEDDPEVFVERLRKYDRETLPIADHYRDQNLLLVVDALQHKDMVTEQIKDYLSKVIPLPV